jgi:hypothetical protein
MEIEKSEVSRTNKTFIVSLHQKRIVDDGAFFQFLLEYQVDTPQQSVARSEGFCQNSKP